MITLTQFDPMRPIETDRRKKNDCSVCPLSHDIHKRIESHRQIILDNKADVEQMRGMISDLMQKSEQRADDLKKTVQPVVDIYKDIAAVGRAGRVIKSVVLWFGGISTALIIGWDHIKQLWPFGHH